MTSTKQVVGKEGPKARRKGCLFSLSEMESEKRVVRDTLIPSHNSKAFSL